MVDRIWGDRRWVTHCSIRSLWPALWVNVFMWQVQLSFSSMVTPCVMDNKINPDIFSWTKTLILWEIEKPWTVRLASIYWSLAEVQLRYQTTIRSPTSIPTSQYLRPDDKGAGLDNSAHLVYSTIGSWLIYLSPSFSHLLPVTFDVLTNQNPPLPSVAMNSTGSAPSGSRNSSSFLS